MWQRVQPDSQSPGNSRTPSQRATLWKIDGEKFQAARVRLNRGQIHQLPKQEISWLATPRHILKDKNLTQTEELTQASGPSVAFHVTALTHGNIRKPH